MNSNRTQLRMISPDIILLVMLKFEILKREESYEENEESYVKDL